MAETPESAPEALAERALDPKNEADVAKAISQLSPEQAQHFVAVLERMIKRRRIQLIGYLVSLVVLLVGEVLALGYYGAVPEGSFVGWVFFLPFAAVGLVLFGFGKWSSRVK